MTSVMSMFRILSGMLCLSRQISLPGLEFGSGCCSAAKQLCCSGQQALALCVFYLRWNLYEPTVTST